MWNQKMKSQSSKNKSETFLSMKEYVNKKNDRNDCIYIFYIFFIISSLNITAQTTPMPTSPSGSNSLAFNSSTEEYYFQFDSEIIYRYSIADGGYSYNSGATLNAVQARGNDGNWFNPSNVGGICANFSTQSGIVEKAPWDIGITYKRISFLTSKDTVIAQWRMKSTDGLIKDSLDYIYKFHISGRTLVIRIKLCNDSTKATRFDLDRCENATKARVIRVPYLTLFNLLYSNNCYTSLFFDWETTNASELNPKTPNEYDVKLDGVTISTTSKRFSQTAKYNPKTDGQRNSLDETIYLTTSPDINHVFPNLVVPAILPQYKTLSASKTVLSYGPPYTWLLTPPECSNYLISSLPAEYRQYAVQDAKYGRNYKLLNLLNRMGIQGLAVIIKNYQRLAFDNGYPKVLPANTFEDCKYICPNENSDNNLQLISLRDSIINNFNYLFALHENYIDAYDPEKTGSGFLMKDCALDSDKLYRRNWKNICGDTSYVISPGKAVDYLTQSATEIKNTIHPNWSYLDVHSALNAPDVIDYDAGKTGAGLFRYVVQQYRSLANILRDLYHGPVEGEGGSNHSFMYVGYFDDMEARLHTADYNVFGYNAPLFVDFDLYKMHSKSAFHGVGHISNFFAPSPGRNSERYSVNRDSILIYIASEFAYGHSGFISKSNVIDQTIYQALLEYKHVYPVQKDYANAMPVSILYGDEQVDASTYIKNHPGYADINSPDFMSKVKVTYDNGIIVCVNRNPSQNWNVILGQSGNWFSYHAIINDNDSLGAGQTGFNSFTLPPRNGWAVYDPLQ
jgi:hypothetical protein